MRGKITTWSTRDAAVTKSVTGILFLFIYF